MGAERSAAEFGIRGVDHVQAAAEAGFGIDVNGQRRVIFGFAQQPFGSGFREGVEVRRHHWNTLSSRRTDTARLEPGAMSWRRDASFDWAGIASSEAEDCGIGRNSRRCGFSGPTLGIL